MTDEETVLSVFTGDEQLTLAEIQSKTELTIRRVRNAVISLQHKTYLNLKPSPLKAKLWLQTWSVAKNQQAPTQLASAQYPELDPRGLEPQFSCHMLALTVEGLHDKSAIAEQLAWRDQRIEALQEDIHKLERQGESAEYTLSATLGMTAFEADGSVASTGDWPAMLAKVAELVQLNEARERAVARAKAGMQDGPQSQSPLDGLEMLIAALCVKEGMVDAEN